MTSQQRASSPSCGARVVFGATLVILTWIVPSPAWAASITERTVLQAEVIYDNSDYAQVVQLLGHPDEIDALRSKPERIRAFKLLAFSYFFLKKPTEAHEAFYGVLRQDPDYQLDRFLDPPAVIEFFEGVRRAESANLGPIRLALQKDREEEERRRKREKEALEAADEIRRLEKLRLVPPPQVIERRVAQNSAFVAWMPFGLGQFQNGHTKLGIALAAGQTLSAITSIACYLSIEALREPDGRFTKSTYTFANRADLAKWIAAGVFYALWVGGAIDANVRFVPERVIGDAPSAAPLGPLKPPEPTTTPKSTVPAPPNERAPATGTSPGTSAPSGVTPGKEPATRSPQG
jgi:hypothetical protein